MSKQAWFCESCKKNGEIEYRKDDGVYLVATKVRKAHARVSPTCITDPRVKIEIKQRKKGSGR